MADLIEGATNHAHYAPLSHGSVQQACRYLQDQIRALDLRITDLHKDLHTSNKAADGLETVVNSCVSNIHALKEKVTSNETRLDTNDKELARSNNNIVNLKQGLHDTNESMGGVRALGEELQVTNANVHKLDKDLANANIQIHKLGETLHRKVDTALQQLRDDLTRTKLDIHQLNEDKRLVKEGLLQEKDNIKQTNERVKALVDQLGATDTKVTNMDRRLGETSGRSKTNQRGLEDLTLETSRLRDEHEHTKKQLGEARVSVTKAHQHVKQVHQSLDTVARGLQHTQKKLDDTCNDTDFSRQSIDDIRSKVRQLENGQDRAVDVIQQLRVQLAETSATTDRVKAGLKEHSSLLLPNLSLDSPEARAATQRHGSLLVTGPLVSTPRPASSRKGRMNTGVPNQMAWT